MTDRDATDPAAAAKARARTTYNDAAPHFDEAPLRFWDRYGQRTVSRLELAPGSRVLDVCCGSGASALAAARRVGPSGSVVAVDLADRLLSLGREKARREALTNVEFRVGDMTDLGFPDASFDAVVIVFAIFFVPDMQAQLRELLRQVRPGGVLAVTTWGPRLFEPLYTPWQESVRRHRPDLASAFNPWDRITTPEAVRSLMLASGGQRVEVEPEAGAEPLERPEDWWTIILGTGLRWPVDQMDTATASVVHDEALAAARDVSAVETNVIYASARR